MFDRGEWSHSLAMHLLGQEGACWVRTALPGSASPSGSTTSARPLMRVSASFWKLYTEHKVMRFVVSSGILGCGAGDIDS